MDRAKILSHALSVVESAETQDDLQKAIHELRDCYKVMHLAYHSRPPEGGDIMFATGDEEFCSAYLEQNAIETDPVVQTARSTALPVDWDSVDRRTRQAKQHFNNLIDYNIGLRGMTIPCYGADGDWGILSFSTNHTERATWLKFRNAWAPDLTFIGMHFHSAAMRIANNDDRASDNKAQLTPQSRRLLTLLANGLRPAMIAKVTGLSIRTVRMHLDNAQHRLGCKTKAATVIKAIDLGLIPRKVQLLAAAILVRFFSDMPLQSMLSPAFA